MSEIPNNLSYTSDHEWILVENGVGTLGITDHAQDQLGDVVFIGDLPEVGGSVDQGDVVAVVESVKTTSDVFAPVSGVIKAVNEALVDAPESLNTSPYEAGWLLKIELSDDNELDDLMDASGYQDLVED